MKITLNQKRQRRGYSVLAMFVVAVIIVAVGTYMTVQLRKLARRLDHPPMRQQQEDIETPPACGTNTNATVTVIFQSYYYAWTDSTNFPGYDSFAEMKDAAAPLNAACPVVTIALTNSVLSLSLTIESNWNQGTLGDFMPVDIYGFPLVYSRASGVSVDLESSTNLSVWSQILNLSIPDPSAVSFRDEDAEPAGKFYRARLH